MALSSCGSTARLQTIFGATSFSTIDESAVTSRNFSVSSSAITLRCRLLWTLNANRKNARDSDHNDSALHGALARARQRRPDINDFATHTAGLWRLRISRVAFFLFIYTVYTARGIAWAEMSAARCAPKIDFSPPCTFAAMARS